MLIRFTPIVLVTYRNHTTVTAFSRRLVGPPTERRSINFCRRRATDERNQQTTSAARQTTDGDHAPAQAEVDERGQEK